MTEKRKKSIEYFHVLPENLNCAQAILKGFENYYDISEEDIAAFRACGGGRVDNGICGALFSAKCLSDETGKMEIENKFREIMGSIYCRELKKNHKACEDCVRVADALLEERIEEEE